MYSPAPGYSAYPNPPPLPATCICHDSILKYKADSEAYKVKEKVANYLTRAFVGLAFGSWIFSRALYGYNDRLAVSMGLLVASYIPDLAEKFFKEKAAASEKLGRNLQGMACPLRT
jgi:hypothetical protein